MNKAQAIHAFWSGFGLPAYDQYTVPQDAQMPYITYSVMTGALNDMMVMNASLWYRSSSWEAITIKADQIAQAIGNTGYAIRAVDGGYLWLTQGSPFAQRMSDDADRDIRRIYLNVNAEFLTAF